MLTPEQRRQFNEILEELAKALDITPAQYEAAVNSYKFVGNWLARPESTLSPYKVEILPQGSFLLGTTVKPENENDDLDVDLVCRLEGKSQLWTQYDLKKLIGDRLKDHETLKRMLDKKEGRRCWTLLHRESAKFHMDILPAVVSKDFKLLFERFFAGNDLSKIDQLAIRITDRHSSNYTSSVNQEEWLKCNPFGYAIWFKVRSTLDSHRTLSLNEAIQEFPENQKEKLPLQRVVQILKRHRDVMFNGDEDKPISIIITTLAAKAYKGEVDLIDALINIVNSMENFIEERYDAQLRRSIKWIANPVNNEENFADKWPASPKKQENFFKWHRALKSDLESIVGQRGLHYIQESLNSPFGKDKVKIAFDIIGERARKSRESGAMKMAAGSGMLGTAGRTDVLYHNNYGGNE